MSDKQSFQELKDILPESRLSFSDAHRGHHARDQSGLPSYPPDVVVWPESEHEVQLALKWANAAGVPVTAWGAGTSLEGNPIPVRGGISLDLRRMNRVLQLHAADLQVTVQAGVLYKDMNAQLAKGGLFFAPDPGANASIGGMVANNAAGLRTVRYGATRENTLGLEVVLANGKIVRTGTRATKQSSGYALTDLFVGSEGTLGVITQATLRLAPIPAHLGAATASFPDPRSAAEAVFDLMGSGLAPSALELLDGRAVHVINQEPEINLPQAPHLLVEFSAPTQSILSELSELARALCEQNGATGLELGLGKQARDRLWAARYQLFEAHRRTYSGHSYMLTDTCVPLAGFADHVEFASGWIDRSQLQGSIVCHAGDGNMHTVVFFPAGDEEARNRAEALNTALVEHALGLDGTVSGEHGIGLNKRRYMSSEHGQTGIELMSTIKQGLDPNGILNPGKVFPEE